jgi:hypothetical protein
VEGTSALANFRDALSTTKEWFTLLGRPVRLKPWPLLDREERGRGEKWRCLAAANFDRFFNAVVLHELTATAK